MQYEIAMSFYVSVRVDREGRQCPNLNVSVKIFVLEALSAMSSTSWGSIAHSNLRVKQLKVGKGRNQENESTRTEEKLPQEG